MSGLGNALAAFWAGMALHLWQTCLVVVPLVILGRVLRRRPHRVTSVIGWLAMAKLLVPLAVVGPVIDHLAGGLVGHPGGLGKASQLLYPEGLVGAVEAPAGSDQLLLLLAVTSVWAVGAYWFVVRHWLRRSPALARASGATEALPHESRRRLELAIRATPIDPATVRIAADSVVPHVSGLRHRRIVLPREAVDELSTEELSGILAHEQAHIERRDPAMEILLGLAMAVFYFYPPLWLVSRWLHESAEYACDEAAVRSGITAETFSRAVAKMLSLQVAPAAGRMALGLSRPSSLRSRFQRLDEPWRYVTMTRHRIILVIAVVTTISLSVVIALFGQTAPAKPDAQPKSTAGSAETQTTAAIKVTKPTQAQPAQTDALDEVPPPDTVIPDVTPPEILRDGFVAPVYPEKAKKAGVQGRVFVKAFVMADGTVSKAVVAEGIADYPEFGTNAVAAVLQWKFKPATSGGEPVGVWVTIPVAYTLQDKGIDKASGEAKK